MDEPRPEKVAVVDEVRARIAESEALLLTEYRGITVGEMARLRRALRAAGGDYKIYKNTLVRFATRELGLDLDALLTGPTAIAFVPSDGEGDPVTVAKALKAFSKENPNLVLKGGLLGERALTADDALALADVAPREELLARLAGGMAAPIQQFAGLLQALPRNFAYGLKALIDEGGAPGAPAATSAPAAPVETAPVETAPVETAPSTDASDESDAPEAAADEVAETPTPIDNTDASDEAAPTEES